ncbi:hypothetical protein G3N96_33475 [Burkholderia sp. Se-20373]|uniref:hypothetical protein n=1 Tax=Burkholderia sp. Se-20373 TaxID=2703898 RepID=UPI0019814928|nr:hypothetical protein [Burkholderia sp. Se-20373]MBN3750295.1 hypothetical protein [Burkholderia sp. Se-20373]
MHRETASRGMEATATCSRDTARRMAAVCTGPIARRLGAGIVPLSVQRDAVPAQPAEPALIRPAESKGKYVEFFRTGNHIV